MLTGTNLLGIQGNVCKIMSACVLYITYFKFNLQFTMTRQRRDDKVVIEPQLSRVCYRVIQHKSKQQHNTFTPCQVFANIFRVNGIPYTLRCCVIFPHFVSNWRISLKYCLITTPMTGWVVTSYLTESSVNAIHEDTLSRISMIRFVHSSKYDRYYTHLVFYDFMCVCLFRFHVKHMNCILCSRRHVIKFLQSLRESARRGIQCKQARILEWTQWITLQKKERYVINASSQGRWL